MGRGPGQGESGDKLAVLLTGATGYVGGRLLPLLERREHPVRCMVRRPASMTSRIADGTEVVAGDVFEPETLSRALRGIDTAYYFVHSMEGDEDFEERDRRAAKNFAAAARETGVRRIIYLGGLGQPGPNLSKHLRSRQETGDHLRESGAQVIEFRASIVIGSGSLSFDLIRALVEKLPVMVCPRWVSVLAQPIAIEDLLAYLLEAIDLPEGESRIYEIGGPDQVSYGDIMKEYARQRHLRRYMIPVPVLTPYLSSLWLGLVTPVHARIGRKLVESLRNPTLVSDRSSDRVFTVRPRGLREAIARALVNEDQAFAASRWSDATSSSEKAATWGGVRVGSRIVDSRTRDVDAPPEITFERVQRIGGTTGWYYGSWLWRLRGLLDLMVGGVGFDRGRRDALDLRIGDTVDCWRVEQLSPPHLLRLRAEMRLPGRAWLEFEVAGEGRQSRLRQTAIFDAVGVLGRLYWYALYPIHQFVFSGMLRNLARASEAAASDTHGATAARGVSRTPPIVQ